MEGVRSIWKGVYERIDFTFEGRDAIVVLPKSDKQEGKWLLKTEYFGAFQDFEEYFVEHGYLLAFVANRNRWAAQIDLDVKARFCAFISREFNAQSRCIPIGMSCGGLIAMKFAAQYPHLVHALYLDSPVVNLLSCPCGIGMKTDIGSENIQILLKELDMSSLSDLIAYRNHPLDVITRLITANIPVALVCGDSDTTVPFEENGAHIYNAYHNSGVAFKFLLKSGVGHHPHGPDRYSYTPFYRFLDAQAEKPVSENAFHWMWIPKKRLLLLPIDPEVPEKKLTFVCGDEKWDFDVQLSGKPTLYAPFDTSRYQEKPCAFLCSSLIEGLPFQQADVLPYHAKSYYSRPEMHFTASFGWLNDPNGLYAYNGEYHLFYQHNPYGVSWGNMHWGHARSSNLMKWEHLPEALYPDEDGTMYSGSALVDYQNRSRLGCCEHPPIFLYYTAAGGVNEISRGKHFSIRAAVSVDGGISFTKISKSLVDGIVNPDRDPKVVFVSEMDAFVMAYYKDNERCHDFELMVSKDLLNWSYLQTISLTEDRECPDLFRVMLPDGKSKWVFSAAAGTYRIGEFINGHLVLEDKAFSMTLHDENMTVYAAQTFDYDAPDGKPRRISWLRLPVANENYNMLLSVPQAMSAIRIADSWMLRGEFAPDILNAMDKVECTPANIRSKLKSYRGRPQILMAEFHDEWSIQAGDQSVACQNGRLLCPTGEFELPAFYQKVCLILDKGVAEVLAADGLCHFAFRYGGKDEITLLKGILSSVKFYSLPTNEKETDDNDM